MVFPYISLVNQLKMEKLVKGVTRHPSLCILTTSPTNCRPSARTFVWWIGSLDFLMPLRPKNTVDNIFLYGGYKIGLPSRFFPILKGKIESGGSFSKHQALFVPPLTKKQSSTVSLSSNFPLVLGGSWRCCITYIKIINLRITTLRTQKFEKIFYLQKSRF